MLAAQQELYTYNGGDNLTGIDKGHVFAPVCLFNHKYYLTAYPDYYFIVRKDKYCNDAECERVCLYRGGVVNEYLQPSKEPFTMWITNDLRCGRRIEIIYRDM